MTTPSAPLPDGEGNAMRSALGPVAAIGAGLAAGAFALLDTRHGVSVLVGAVIATSNLYVLIRVVEALLTPPDDEASEAKAAATDAAIAPPDEPGPEAPAAPAADPPPPAKRTYSGAWAVLGAVKMLVLFGGIWALMTRALVDPLGLAVGYGCLPLGVLLRGVLPGLRPRAAARPGRREP